MTQPTPAPFVGEDRQQLLGDLRQAWDGVKSGKGARLVTLAAPTGWGKTRVIQELYGGLVSETGGGYWPPSLQVPDTSWLQARKRVFPAPFDVPQGATIPFLWLGVSCQKDQMGRRLAALQYAEEQFQAHVGPMAKALAERGERWKARLSAVGAVAGLFGLPDPVQMAMTWHGIARSTWDLMSGEWSVFQGRRQGRTARHVDTEGLAPTVERARALAEQIAKLSGEDLPVVLVVDDAHWADPGTVTFLDALLGGPGHVLVLATAWPDQLAVQASDPETFGGALPGWVEDGVARRIDLAPLPEASLEMLVLARAADPDEVAPRLVAALCQRAGGNPNRLEGLLSLRVVRRALASSAAGGGLTDDEIQALPTGDGEIYQAIWRELPEGVQEALALTTVQGPRFNPQWIPAAAELLELTGAEAGLAAARAPWGWVRSLDAALDAFVEAGLFERAREEAASLFLPRELEEARAAMLSWAVATKQRDDWPALSTSARRAVLEAHVTALEDGLVEVDEDALDSVDQLTRLMWEGEELEALTVLARKGIAWAEDRPALRGFWWRFRIREAMAVGQSGRTDEALTRMDALLAEVEKEAGEGPVEVQAVRRLRAHWLVESGRLTEARAEFEDLLATWREERGPDDVLTLEARARIATCLRQEGKVPEALERLEDIVDDSVRALGPDAEDTLLRRHELAVALMDAGRMEEALGSLRPLLATRVRRSGPDAFETLNVRRSLDACLLGLARWDDAVEALRASADDHRRVMGPDHPATLRVLGHLAQALGGSGAVGEALQVQLHLAQERARIQGTDHPNTATARHNLASILVRAGELDAAIKLFTAVLSHRYELFGADHPDTMATMNNLAICYLRAGQHAEAGPLLEAVHAYRLERLGADHPQTEAALQNLEAWRAESGGS